MFLVGVFFGFVAAMVIICCAVGMTGNIRKIATMKRMTIEDFKREADIEGEVIMPEEREHATKGDIYQIAMIYGALNLLTAVKESHKVEDNSVAEKEFKEMLDERISGLELLLKMLSIFYDMGRNDICGVIDSIVLKVCKHFKMELKESGDNEQ